MNKFIKFHQNILSIKFIQLIINFSFYFLKEFSKKYSLYKKYTGFNKKFLLNKKKSNNKIILVEMFKFNKNILSLFIWSIFFKKKGYKNFYCYPPKINALYHPITFFIYKKLGFKFISYFTNYKQEKLVIEIYSRIDFKKISKKQFLKFKYKNTKIGDLIYDDYLRFHKKPTIDFEDQKFKDTVKNGIRIAVFWDDYFKKNNVDYICYSHAVYLIGIPARISLNFKTSNLNVCGNFTHRISKKYLYQGDEFKFLKKTLLKYCKLKKIRPKNLFKETENEIRQKMEGKITKLDDLPFYFKKIYNHKFSKEFELKTKIIINKNKFNVLIATHDFFEGPNSEGEFIFADYYEWLKYLFDYASKDNTYNWYIKPHPDFDSIQLKILKNLIPNKKNIILLPIKTPNNFLIKNGINFVLTNHGTISPEFAFNNIPTLLCSNSNFFNNLNFAIKSNSLKEYQHKLDRLDKINIKINKPDVLMYFYYQRHFFNDPIKFKIFPPQTANANPIISLDNTVFTDDNSIINGTYNKFYDKEEKLNKIFKIFNFFINNKNLFQLIDTNKVL